MPDVIRSHLHPWSWICTTESGIPQRPAGICGLSVVPIIVPAMSRQSRHYSIKLAVVCLRTSCPQSKRPEWEVFQTVIVGIPVRYLYSKPDWADSREREGSGSSDGFFLRIASPLARIEGFA